MIAGMTPPPHWGGCLEDPTGKSFNIFVPGNAFQAILKPSFSYFIISIFAVKLDTQIPLSLLFMFNNGTCTCTGRLLTLIVAFPCHHLGA